MGIFNYVDLSMDCPCCGKLIKEFQTKEGEDVFMNRVPFWGLSNFYNSCDFCGTWVEFTLKKEFAGKDFAGTLEVIQPMVESIQDYHITNKTGRYAEKSAIVSDLISVTIGQDWKNYYDIEVTPNFNP